MEEGRNPSGVHKVIMHNRRDAVLTGVVDVMSFDEEEILMETTEGMLSVKGEGLHVKKLTLEKGEVELEGVVDSFSYSGKKSKGKEESLINRLFK